MLFCKVLYRKYVGSWDSYDIRHFINSFLHGVANENLFDIFVDITTHLVNLRSKHQKEEHLQSQNSLLQISYTKENTV